MSRGSSRELHEKILLLSVILCTIYIVDTNEEGVAMGIIIVTRTVH
jgi:hypothetical protein